MTKKIFKKFLNEPLIILFVPLHIIIILIIVIMRPFKKFNIYKIPSDRIGHFVGNTLNYYNYSKKYNIKTFYFFARQPVNNYLKRNYKKKLTIFPKIFLEVPHFFLGIFLNIFGKDVKNRDIYNLVDKSKKINFFFNSKDASELKKKINKFNVNKKPIAALLFRDQNYLKTLYPNSDLSYHDYRNIKINEHLYIIKELIKLGYFVVRIGSVVSSKVNHRSKNFFDYSRSNYQNEKNDICIMSLANVLVTTSTGLDEIAPALKIPMLIINMAPIGDLRSYSKLNILLPQKYYSSKYKKILNFDLIKREKIQYCYNSWEFKKKNIRLIKNSKYEVIDGLKKLHFVSTSKTYKQSKLNKFFWKSFKSKFHFKNNIIRMHGKYHAIIPEYFLKKNKSFYL